MKRDSLSWQILRRVLLIHALAALLLTATQLWYDYQGNIKVIENQLSNAYKMFGSSVADAFYYADKNMIKQIFKGALSHSDYTGMLLYDSIADEYLSQGSIPGTLDPLKKEMVEKPGVFYLPNSGGLFGYQHQLTIIDDLGQQQILGHMVVFSEKRLAINQLKATVLIIILNSMLKAAVLVFMFLMMFNRILLRPLRRIVSTVEEIDPDNLDQVELNLGLPQNNELTLLENHLNQLFKSLHNSQKEIQTFNKKLETKVKARTLELNQAKHELDIVVETVPAMLWYLDTDQQVRYTNKMAARMSELTPEQAIGKNVIDLFPEEFAKDYQRDNEAVLLSGEAKHRFLQTILDPESGKDICIQTEKIPVLSENGEAEGLLVFSIDITEQKQAEVALRKSEAELQALFDGMTDLVFLFNKEGRYLKIAAVTEDLLYEPASELLGKTIEEVLPNKQAEYFIDNINLSIDKQQAVSLVYSFKIGTKEVWFDARISPLPDKRVIFVARDITEMKRAELEIQLAKEFAEQANIEKSHFLAAASHDLRQPLNSMGLFLYALRQRSKNCDDNKLITLVDQIDGSFLALKNLFDSLLEISHLDAGTINTVSKNFKTSVILQPLVDDMSELAAEKKLDISYQSSACHLYADP
ncbi:MAG: PAS domain-containing protein, partial [Methyloprofundus sp.]|nr:PAS domain-containing protein [Methyloprofundus sp.]